MSADPLFCERGGRSINSSIRLPTSARLSTLGSLEACNNKVFHFALCERGGGGPGAPAASNSAFSVWCDPSRTSATAAQTATGRRTCAITAMHLLGAEFMRLVHAPTAEHSETPPI